MAREYKTALERLAGRTGRVYWTLSSSFEQLAGQVRRDFPGAGVKFDSKLTFNPNNIGGVISGDKTCTIRFGADSVHLPKHPKRDDLLDCVVDVNGLDVYIGLVRVYTQVFVSRARNFPEILVQHDGFRNKSQMIEALSGMYKQEIKPSGLLSYYQIDEFYPDKDNHFAPKPFKTTPK